MSVTLTMLKDVQISSPYHSFLALNRGSFSEGLSCHHFDPIRYVVREASHPIITAMAARSRRNRQEHAEYFKDNLLKIINKYTYLYSFVSQTMNRCNLHQTLKGFDLMHIHSKTAEKR